MKLPSSPNILAQAGWKPAPLWLAAVLLAAAALSFAAEDDEVVVGPITPDPEQQIQRFVNPDFDQMLFQNDGNATLGEQRMRDRVDLQMADIDRACRLSDAQKQKLQLAARGDIQRFFSEADVLRRKFDQLMQDQKANAPNAFNKVWQQMWQDMQPLQVRLSAGLTAAPASLLMKVIPKTLTAEQQRDYDAITAERRRFRYEASIAVSLHELEEIVAFSDAQREELVKLLAEMPTPRQFGPYDMYVVLIRLGTLPAQKLEPLFEAAQWKALKTHLDQYRNVRESWIQSGVLDPEDFPEPAAQAKPAQARPAQANAAQEQP